jgi:NAD(P)-dependent dehydrogenase (short-subunit alcohol dehydrogenase family)
MRSQSPHSDLKHGTTVIVGAGGGLGRALTDACCARPARGRVFALSRRPPAAGSTDDTGVTPTWITADPTDPESLHAAVTQIQALSPRVHRLIICTGVLHGGTEQPAFKPEKSLAQLELDALLHSMTLNAWAPLAALQAFAPLLRHEERSVATALSAMVGSIGDNRLGGWHSYRMSKAALNMGLKNAAIELGRHRHGPIVVAIHPGTTLSRLSEPFAGPDRARPAARSAAAILEVLDGLEPAQSGRFFNWDGSEIPW